MQLGIGKKNPFCKQFNKDERSRIGGDPVFLRKQRSKLKISWMRRKFTFLRSEALTVPSLETWSWYFLPVLSSTTVKLPARFVGGNWAERGIGRRASWSVSSKGRRWAASMAKRPRACTVAAAASELLDMFSLQNTTTIGIQRDKKEDLELEEFWS